MFRNSISNLLNIYIVYLLNPREMIWLNHSNISMKWKQVFPHSSHSHNIKAVSHQISEYSPPSFNLVSPLEISTKPSKSFKQWPPMEFSLIKSGSQKSSFTNFNRFFTPLLSTVVVKWKTTNALGKSLILLVKQASSFPIQLCTLPWSTSVPRFDPHHSHLIFTDWRSRTSHEFITRNENDELNSNRSHLQCRSLCYLQ